MAGFFFRSRQTFSKSKFSIMVAFTGGFSDFEVNVSSVIADITHSKLRPLGPENIGAEKFRHSRTLNESHMRIDFPFILICSFKLLS